MNVPAREWIKSKSPSDNSNVEVTTESISTINKQFDNIFENLAGIASELKITAERYQIQINQNEIDNLLTENCKLEDDIKDTENDEEMSSIHIKIGQFNCYAQYLTADKSHLPWMTLKCPRQYLQWQYRSKRLLFELLQYKLDIICLQEVDKYWFDHFFFPNLTQNTDKIPIKYNGIYLRKSVNHERNNIPLDGCAIFWNTQKFRYKDQTQCTLGSTDCVNIGLGVRLAVLDQNNAEIDIWTTHLKAGRKNKMEKYRVEQTKILIENILKYSCLDYKGNRKIFFCGDLNSTPDDTHKVIPKVYPLLTNNTHRIGTDDNNKFGLKLSSLYAKSMINKEPSYTGWVGFMDRNVKGTLDYIFYGQIVNMSQDETKNDDQQDQDCILMEVLNIFDEDLVRNNDCYLPNEWYPSDHLLIAASVCLEFT